MSNTLQNKVQAEKDFDTIILLADAHSLFRLATLVCNKVSVNNQLPTRMGKSLAVMMKSNENYMGLADFYDSFAARCKVGKVAGLSFDTEMFQKHMMAEKPIKTGGDTIDVNDVDYCAEINKTNNGHSYTCMFLHMARLHSEIISQLDLT